MKPSFALSLSFDGIRLLHRAAGGWRLVGDVALDSADMAGELATLRKTATALEPGGLRTKLLLPNEQIKYLTIDTAGMSDDERYAAARLALDGATPYAVSDLAFDISADGDQTHVAAVAHETLAEAEAFAVEHRFHPVSFAAVPGDLPYLGEPFFGQTESAVELLEGETVEPDGIAVVVVGSVKLPEDTAATVDQAAPEPEAQTPEPPAAQAEDTAPLREVDSDSIDSKTGGTEQSDVPPAPLAQEAAQNQSTPRKKPSLGGAQRGAAPAVAAAPAPPTEPATSFTSRRSPVAAPGAAPQSKPSVIAPNVLLPEEDEAPSASKTASAGAVTPPPPASPAPKAPAPRGGFLSRRKSKAPKSRPPAPVAAPADEINNEAERMTIFGARRTAVGGKPRFLGLILTVALLVFLAGVAAWASVFLDDGLKLSRLFGLRSEPERAFSDPIPETPPVQQEAPIQTAALDSALTEEDSAVLEALRAPVQPALQDLSEAELEAKYAATGIWSRAPEVPPEPAALVTLDDLYLTSIDPVSTSTDAVALPDAAALKTDLVLAALASPAAPGTLFSLDDRGLVIPTLQGALSPDGYTVYLGRPDIIPPPTPTRFQSEPQDTGIRDALAAIRPQPRPGDLVESYERGQNDGLTRAELGALRPALRPQSLQERAATLAQPEISPADADNAVAAALSAPAVDEDATKFAVAASVRPDSRPRNFDRIVKRAQRAAPAEEVRVASAAAVAPRTVKPKIPTKASVAKSATVKNAINLRKINLIGVYGKPSSRRALVRLSSGRYRKVVVGDRIDGGRVSAIGESELRYTKGGRNMVLKMPRG